MLRPLRTLTLIAAALCAGAAFASDHRESPSVQADPTADLTDFFAFLNPRDSAKLVLAMAVNPFQTTVQEGAYHFSPDVRYRFNIDNNGDAVPDRVIEFRFGAYDVTARKQTYTARIGKHGPTIEGVVTEGTRITHEPNPPIIAEGPGGIKVFAGTRDDPFFIDTVGVQRTFAGTGRFTATDALAGYNVSAIVLEVPLAMVQGRGTKLGMWADSARPVPMRGYAAALMDEADSEQKFGHQERFVQIQRAGNPAVKVIFVPDALKDAYNKGIPKTDAANWSKILIEVMRAPAFSLKESEVQRLAALFAPDMLHLDVSKPVKFPNGRWLDDDSIDIMFESNLFTDLPILYRRGELDGVNHNDVPFSNEFPYLAPPHQAP
jgi:hypothetical protein